MAISKIHPVHAINKYLWSRIEAEPGLMSKIPYQGFDYTPIVPVEETPELITMIDAQPGVGGTHTYIVYTWSKTSTGQAWWMKTHQIAYAIRSTDDEKMRQLINLFDREFQDFDAAAQRVNAYIQTSGTAAHKRYHFKHIHVAVLGGQMPAESENGENESLVTISVTFTES